MTPHFNRNPIDIVTEAERAGAKTDSEIVGRVVEQLKDKKLRFCGRRSRCPGELAAGVVHLARQRHLSRAPRGMSSSCAITSGRTTTPSPTIAPRARRARCKYRDPAPRGKFDLVVDINFRMDSSALYSDIVLPTAFWYEKNDLNSTDLHSFIHNLGAAVPPVFESKTDWEIFKLLARKVSEMAPLAFPKPVRDLVATPLMHDTPDELAQPQVLDWAEGECEPVPGKTMPHLRVVERDYANIYNKFISFGPMAREDGLSCNGVHVNIKKQYDQMLENPVMPMPDPRHMRCVEWGGKRYPSLEDVLDACNTLLIDRAGDQWRGLLAGLPS